ncbi:MAG: penicillin-binding protein 1B [Gammaproteobacteria bacterium]|nr:penicillin-binding protein 1B [Gammaproteobacteria bacterium]
MPHRPTRKRKHSEKIRKVWGRLRRLRSSGKGVVAGWKLQRKHLWRGLAVLAGLLVLYVGYLDFVVRDQFEHKRWAIPAHVYARPLEVFVGLPLAPDRFAKELVSLNYRYAYPAKDPASYQREGDNFEFTTREFHFWDAQEPSHSIRVEFTNNVVTALKDRTTGNNIELVRLDPAFIGGIYPAHHEDRILVKYDEVPSLLPQTLITIEDRKFLSHHGIDIRGIVRALWQNLKAGATEQGGSTITQQLVKNFYLSSERSLWRKFNEIIMALLLDFHYQKKEIMEAYLNEIYLGQDGQRAIHGFGLASRFYFEKPLNELSTAQIATLVALIRGPGFYHPEKHTKRLLQRRNLILDTLAEFNIVTQQEAQFAKQQTLGVIAERRSGITDYPAFLDLVQRQLREFYRDEDLSSEGLRIFTTLDPVLQQELEAVVHKRVEQLDQQRHLHGKLQAAAVLTTINPSVEVLAMVGDRNPRFAGFNRAVDAIRPIGSLMKPAVFLAALNQPSKYNWLTTVEDAPLTLKSQEGQTWSPRNYDNKSHGSVALISALTQSYNQATVNLGMAVDFPAIIDTLHRLGVKRNIPAYPSSLLGAVEMSPLEVVQMYQTFASGGFQSPLRAIREVMNAQGERLRRYPIEVQKTFEPGVITVLNSGLTQVVEAGTAKSVRQQLPKELLVAGKTGTTNDTRDSWFAGFSASHVGVVWVGTDDNQPTGLSGSSGALRIWGDMMSQVATTSLSFESGDGIEMHWVDPVTRRVTDKPCEGGMNLGFVKDTAPREVVDCSGNVITAESHWLPNLFK